jgi:hypothetical protein
MRPDRIQANASFAPCQVFFQQTSSKALKAFGEVLVSCHLCALGIVSEGREVSSAEESRRSLCRWGHCTPAAGKCQTSSPMLACLA